MKKFFRERNKPMKYDFTSIIDRHGMDAIAVDLPDKTDGFAPSKPKEGFDQIPMWVADMNFPTVPSVIRAITDRAQHPMFGYFSPRKEYFDAVINWQEERNGVKGLTAECIGYENGVLGGVVSALEAFTAPGDKVLVHSPTYIGFEGSVANCGRALVHSSLIPDDRGVLRMNYKDMEEKIQKHRIHTAIFCSPHNPCGRVWERWEIEEAMEIYRRNDVIVISDEIWSDIILDGYRHIPTQSVSEDARNRTIAMYAPSKTFNLAGLVGSYHIIYNSLLRDRVRACGSKSHYNSMNLLSMYALIGAYTQEGHEWVDELCAVITENVDYACNFIEHNLKGVRTTRPQGTYMLYLDCTEYCKRHGKTVDDLLAAAWDVGVDYQDGRPFQKENTIRMNLALPMERIQEAMRRLKRYVFIDSCSEHAGEETGGR